MRDNEEGQAVVEYILMVVLVISVVGILTYGFRKSIMGLWVNISRDITSACPHDCPPDTQNIR